MKIYTRTEMNKGYIPNDKVRYKNIPFEIYGLNNFLDKDKLKVIDGLHENFKQGNIEKTTLLNYIKFEISLSTLFKKIKREKYHTHLYLNINKNGVDCFISR